MDYDVDHIGSKLINLINVLFDKRVMMITFKYSNYHFGTSQRPHCTGIENTLAQKTDYGNNGVNC